MRKQKNLYVLGLALLMVVLLASTSVFALETVIGETKTYLDAARENIRTKETTAGNLVIDAMRDYTGADVGITNGGGIREAVEPGKITLGDVLTLLPFENSVVTIELTGAEIIEVLEFGVSQYPELWGGFLHVSNLSFTFDSSKEIGKRIVEVRYQDAPIDPAAKFIVATNGFLSAGGDGFEMMAKPSLEEFGDMQEIFIKWLRDNSPVAPAIEGRIIRIGD